MSSVQCGGADAREVSEGSMNRFEVSGRFRKVVALLAALDCQAARAGIPPLAGADGAKTVRELSKADWKALCREFDLRPPSIVTVELVAEGIEARRGPVRAVRQLELISDRKVAS